MDEILKIGASVWTILYNRQRNIDLQYPSVSATFLYRCISNYYSILWYEIPIMKVSQYFCKWIVPSLKHRKHGSLKRGSLSLGQIYAFPPVLITSTAQTVTLIH